MDFTRLLRLFPYVHQSTSGKADWARADVEFVDDRYQVTASDGGSDKTYSQYIKKHGQAGSKFKSEEFGMEKGIRLHEGAFVGGSRDVMARLRPGEAVLALDDPATLQMMQMLTTNAMTKGTNSGIGGGGASAIIAPSNSTVSVKTDNIFASSPITRNPEKTYNRVSYQ